MLYQSAIVVLLLVSFGQTDNKSRESLFQNYSQLAPDSFSFRDRYTNICFIYVDKASAPRISTYGAGNRLAGPALAAVSCQEANNLIGKTILRGGGIASTLSRRVVYLRDERVSLCFALLNFNGETSLAVVSCEMAKSRIDGNTLQGSRRTGLLSSNILYSRDRFGTVCSAYLSGMRGNGYSRAPVSCSTVARLLM